mmetsp:Transcript_84018/g.242884  ORF Transcript_84018/g.242884 Transcript_84018/m.242884 type:complete len:356 (-) Transcript_84018:128-1195(-)
MARPLLRPGLAGLLRYLVPGLRDERDEQLAPGELDAVEQGLRAHAALAAVPLRCPRGLRGGDALLDGGRAPGDKGGEGQGAVGDELRPPEREVELPPVCVGQPLPRGQLLVRDAQLLLERIRRLLRLPAGLLTVRSSRASGLLLGGGARCVHRPCPKAQAQNPNLEDLLLASKRRALGLHEVALGLQHSHQQVASRCRRMRLRRRRESGTRLGSTRQILRGSVILALLLPDPVGQAEPAGPRLGRADGAGDGQRRPARWGALRGTRRRKAEVARGAIRCLVQRQCHADPLHVRLLGARDRLMPPSNEGDEAVGVAIADFKSAVDRLHEAPRVELRELRGQRVVPPGSEGDAHVLP